ncbi:MAG: hypothetical protein CM1200mP20_05560 [Pseudomonadota bacterium]|nr:MAG: hypothetical protein CM1200mP20_05560 [Pseudomonadota bacterium]
MQRIVHDNCSVIIPIFSAYGHASSDKLKRPSNVALNWEFDGHKKLKGGGSADQCLLILQKAAALGAAFFLGQRFRPGPNRGGRAG